MLTEQQLAEMLARNPALLKRNPHLQGLMEGMKKSSATTRSPKYRNTKVYLYGEEAVYGVRKEGVKPDAVYDSIKEYERHKELTILEKAGIISNLRRQVPIPLTPAVTLKSGKKIRAITYKADYMYEEEGRVVVEDVKTFDKKTQRFLTTKDFDIKLKLMQSLHEDWKFVLV